MSPYGAWVLPLLLIACHLSLLCCSLTQDWGAFHESKEAEAEDERNDGQILQDVLFSISEWKDRQQRKLIQKLFHSRKRRDEEVTCYGDLGCFRDEGPFNYLDMLPSPPEEVGTVFYLYTRHNEELPQVLQYNNITSVTKSHFNASCATKVIIHGFGSSCDKVWAREMRLSFLAVDDCNVICVDWAAGAVDPNYVRAAVNTRLVGKQVALLIQAINKEFGDINNNTHLVGFSLGAHVSGFVGKELRNLSRITGLDPAGPLFEGYSPKVRLDKTDADYVDVIHSNGDSLIIGGLGAWEPIGHTDFYPNGGKAQRGCQNLLIGGLYDFIYSYSTKNESYRYLCNHRRAYKLFTDSISPKCKFTAFPCDSYEKFESGQCFTCNSEVGECGELGYRSNLSPGRGSLYLLTREEEPFCANQFKINLMFTGSRLPLYSYGALQMKLINHDGINETFSLTSAHDELLTSGAKIEKLIVAHPAIDRPVEVQILYIAYEGWIYTGRYQWSIDKLTITDGFGKQLSFCNDLGELLPSGVPISRKLKLGDCLTSLHKPDFPLLIDKLPKKSAISANLRPPLPTDISKLSHHNLDLSSQLQHSNFVTDIPPIKQDLVIHTDHRPIHIPDFDPELDLTTVPKPLLLSIEQHVTLVNIPGKPSPQLQTTKYTANNSIKKASQVQVQPWNNKYPGVSSGSLPSLQPYHLAGPPGAWNIVTSKPGSLPPPIHVYQSKFSTSKPGKHSNNGIELQYGPPLPLPPLPHRPGIPAHSPFPARRRPSTSVHKPWPRLPIDLSFGESETTLAVASLPSATETLVSPATERTDQIREEDVIIIDNSAQPYTEVTAPQQPITNDDILSDDQLAIFKVGPDNDVERVLNMSSFDHNVSNPELTAYKYVILHKLPNGEALNLENLKTYNYEDIINDYKDQFSYTNEAPVTSRDDFDRENLEYFDVPRHQADTRNRYIIYQVNDSPVEQTKESSDYSNKFQHSSKGIRPVYRPAITDRVHSIQGPTDYVYTPTRKSPVFVPQTKLSPTDPNTSPLSKDDMKLLQTKVEEILSTTGRTETPAVHLGTHNVTSPPPTVNTPALPSSVGIPGTPGTPGTPLPVHTPTKPGNDWIPTDTHYKEMPRHSPGPAHIRTHPNFHLHQLTKLSQLASVSITDAGSLADTVQSIRAAGPHRPGRLTIQLLPPRLSAVLTHLDSPQAGQVVDRKMSAYREQPGDRHQAARAINPGQRQNKVAPAFQPARNREAKVHGARNSHGRTVSGEEYIITHPYQTQLIPKERGSRFIPLASAAPKPVPWWHPGQPSLVQRPLPHHSRNQQKQQGPHPAPHLPITMSNNLQAPGTPAYEAARPVRLLYSKDSHLISNMEAMPHTNPIFIQRKLVQDLVQEMPTSTLSSVRTNNYPTIDTLLADHSVGTIEKNLERINTLEKKAAHIQKPFLPSLTLEDHTPIAVLSPPASGARSGTLHSGSAEIFPAAVNMSVIHNAKVPHDQLTGNITHMADTALSAVFSPYPEFSPSTSSSLTSPFSSTPPSLSPSPPNTLSVHTTTPLPDYNKVSISSVSTIPPPSLSPNKEFSHSNLSPELGT